MAEHYLQWLSEHGLFLTVGTVLFFTAKGLLWLILPAMVVRRVRTRFKKR